VLSMARPTKLTPEIQPKIGNDISLGLTYALVTETTGITYQTYNQWMQRRRNSTSGEYYQFYKHVKKCNSDGARKLLERLNDTTEAVNSQVCMWILERRFPEEFGKRLYRKINTVSENKNENVEITIKEANLIRKQILAKFDRVG